MTIIGRLISAFIALLALQGCGPSETAPSNQEPVRSVRTVVAEFQTPQPVRIFPSVLEPPELTQLAFEVGGRLGEVDLQIGQRVEEGETLLTINPVDFDIRVQQAEATLAEATSGMRNAEDEVARQQTLFEQRVVSQAARDRAETQLEQAQARVEQAQRSLDLVEKSQSDTRLKAPFDGVVNVVQVSDFANVKAGDPIVSLYVENGFQATILVSYDVVSKLEVGQGVTIRPADRDSDVFDGRITEIAGRARAVSSFPVVVTLEAPAPYLRLGMAVEISIAMPVTNSVRGIFLPIGALATHQIDELEMAGASGQRAASLFIYDPENSLVVPRKVVIGGIAGTEIIVVDGLQEGERVVTAGASFLKPGQEVTLWEGDRGDGPGA